MRLHRVRVCEYQQEYSNSPATYEQTNARASHILVADEAQCQKIKDDIAAGSIDFAGAAMQYSTCNSAQQGGKLGKFVPGTMVPEFDDVVFGVYDTGSINLGNGADMFAPKYEMNNEDGLQNLNSGRYSEIVKRLV